MQKKNDSLFRLIRFFIILWGFLFLSCPAKADPQTWDKDYHRLWTRVEQAYNEPRGDPPRLEPYLQWMERKARDRDEISSLLKEAKELSRQKPDDEYLKVWVEKFTELLRLAQASGENTVNSAVMRLMRIREPGAPKSANWQGVLWKLKNYGRQIYLKARETRFSTRAVRATAKCMINFSIRDVEGGNLGVYKGRKGNIVIPDRDFDIDCEPRSSFSYNSRGEPAVPTDTGLDWINQVREEARWWNFGDAVKDATDLMEEYFKDSMCKTPPNRCEKGHKHYKELAQKYKLPKGLEYNKGFYGTVFGRVEAETSSGLKPLKYANIKIQSQVSGETWKGVTDENGRYEIDQVVLHKECKPLKITVTAGNDRKTETFYGPLEKPDPGYRYERNFVFKKPGGTLQIVLHASWDYTDTNKNVRYKGFIHLTVNGSQKIDITRGDFQRYVAVVGDNLSISYNFNAEEYYLFAPCYGKISARYSGQGEGKSLSPEAPNLLINLYFFNNRYDLTLNFKGDKHQRFHVKSSNNCVLKFDQVRSVLGLLVLTGPLTKNRLAGQFQWKGPAEITDPIIINNTLINPDVTSFFYDPSAVSIDEVDYTLSFHFTYKQ